MTKKLVIRFVKFECALVAQQLGTKGQFEASENVLIARHGVDFADEAIWILPEKTKVGSGIAVKYFNSNIECDIYLEKVIKWISEEQFATSGKLASGATCKVSDNEKDWFERKLITVLPENFEHRYIAVAEDDKTRWCSWRFARSVSCVHPQIEDDLYTWEMEVSE